MIFRCIFLVFFIPACNQDYLDLSDSKLGFKDSLVIVTDFQGNYGDLQKCFSNVHYLELNGNDYAAFFNAVTDELICIPNAPGAQLPVKKFRFHSEFKADDFFICNDSLYLFSADQRRLNVYRFTKDTIPVSRSLESPVKVHLRLSTAERVEIIRQLKQPYLAFSNGHLHTSLSGFRNVYAHGCMDLQSSNQVYQFGDGSSEPNYNENNFDTKGDAEKDIIIGYAFTSDLVLYSIENNRLNKYLIRDESDIHSENGIESKTGNHTHCVFNGTYKSRLIEFPYGNNLSRILKQVHNAANTKDLQNSGWNLQIINPENTKENDCISLNGLIFTPDIAWFWKSGIVLSRIDHSKRNYIAIYFYQYL